MTLTNPDLTFLWYIDFYTYYIIVSLFILLSWIHLVRFIWEFKLWNYIYNHNLVFGIWYTFLWLASRNINTTLTYTVWLIVLCIGFYFVIWRFKVRQSYIIFFYLILISFLLRKLFIYEGIDFFLYLFLWVCVIFSLWFVVFFGHILVQAILGFGVPFVPTPDYKIQKLIGSLKCKKWDVFLDIWCGDGKVIEAVKSKFPDIQCFGIENSLYPYLLSKKRKKINKLDYEVVYWNFFKKDFSQFNIIYCYLLPLHMKKVWKKISNECKPGTILYSSAFQVPDTTPSKKILIEKDKYFYVYEL